MSNSGTPRPSRRALLSGLAGAAAAAAAASVGRALPATATTPPAVELGVANSTDHLTTITNTANSAFKGIGTGGGTGVEGDSSSGAGVYGFSDTGQGVWGEGTDLGVYGHSYIGTAIEADSPSGTSLYAHSTDGIPIMATSQSPDLPAVIGGSAGGNTGLQGFSGQVNPPLSPNHTGVFGSASVGPSAVGVNGQSTTGRGAVFTGKLAQLRLSPASTASHPSSGSRGDFFVDKSGRLWFCKGGTQWKQLA